MGKAVEQLLAYQHSGEAYTVSYQGVRALQVEALNERLQEQIDRIKLVKLRADDAGISEIRSIADIVPLLLPHTAYKSYPESFLTAQSWDKLTKWIGSVSSYPVDNVDLAPLSEQWTDQHMVE